MGAVALVALVAGCGGHGGATRADVIARGDAICETAARAIRSLPATTHTRRHLATYLARASTIVDGEVRQLQALPRPADHRGDLDRYLASIAAAAGTYRTMAADAGRGDAGGLAAATARLRANPAVRDAEAYGLTGCAGGATVGST